MDGTRALLAALVLGLIGVALVTAGSVLVTRGLRGRDDIRAELARQKITFPGHGLPADLAGHAGRTVRNGAEARAFSEMIAADVRAITGGRTYAEISTVLTSSRLANGRREDDRREDEKLAALHETAFMGEMLRAALMSAYQAWQVTSLATGLGVLLIGIGALLLVLAAAFTPAL